MRTSVLVNWVQAGILSPPPPVPNIVVDTASVFDPAKLIVGNTLGFARDPGAYTEYLAGVPTGGVITETGFSYVVNGYPQTSGYTLQAGDTTVSVTFELYVDGLPAGVYLSIADSTVAYAVPTADDVSAGDWEVPDGTGPWDAPDAFVVGNWTATDANTDGEIDIVITALPADNGIPIDDLGVSVDGGSITSLGAAVTGSYSVTGLTNATAYDFNIYAHNTNGWSAISDTKNRTPTLAAGGSITFVGYASNQGTGATIDVDVSTLYAIGGGAGGTLAAGDLMVAHGSIGDVDTAMGPTTGTWVEVSDLYVADTRQSNSGVDYQFVSGTPPTTVNCKGSNQAGRGGCAIVSVWRGVNSTTPQDVTATTASGIDTDAADGASVTPSTAGAVILVTNASSRPATNPGALGSGPANMTRVIALTGAGSSRSAFLSLEIKTDWASGAFNPDALTGTNASTADAWTSTTMVLRPA